MVIRMTRRNILFSAPFMGVILTGLEGCRSEISNEDESGKDEIKVAVTSPLKSHDNDPKTINNNSRKISGDDTNIGRDVHSNTGSGTQIINYNLGIYSSGDGERHLVDAGVFQKTTSFKTPSGKEGEVNIIFVHQLHQWRLGSAEKIIHQNPHLSQMMGKSAEYSITDFIYSLKENQGDKIANNPITVMGLASHQTGVKGALGEEQRAKDRAANMSQVCEEAFPQNDIYAMNLGISVRTENPSNQYGTERRIVLAYIKSDQILDDAELKHEVIRAMQTGQKDKMIFDPNNYSLFRAGTATFHKVA
jgi:hypothetical protein